MCICIGVSVQLLVHHLFRKMKQITVFKDDNPEMINSFQLVGDAIGNVPPTFLLASDLLLSQSTIDCCRNVFASGALPRTPLGCLQRKLDAPPQKTHRLNSGLGFG